MKLTRSEIAAVKRVAATCEPLMKKKEKINKKIDELTAEIEVLNDEIKVWEQGIKNRTGYGVEELIEREVVNGVTKFKIREDLLEEQVEEEQKDETQESAIEHDEFSGFNEEAIERTETNNEIF